MRRALSGTKIVPSALTFFSIRFALAANSAPETRSRFGVPCAATNRGLTHAPMTAIHASHARFLFIRPPSSLLVSRDIRGHRVTRLPPRLHALRNLLCLLWVEVVLPNAASNVD